MLQLECDQSGGAGAAGWLPAHHAAPELEAVVTVRSDDVLSTLSDLSSALGVHFRRSCFLVGERAALVKDLDSLVALVTRCNAAAEAVNAWASTFPEEIRAEIERLREQLEEGRLDVAVLGADVDIMQRDLRLLTGFQAH
jgi:hypothetical protein